jgi:hypothetical protein
LLLRCYRLRCWRWVLKMRRRYEKFWWSSEILATIYSANESSA